MDTDGDAHMQKRHCGVTGRWQPGGPVPQSESRLSRDSLVSCCSRTSDFTVETSVDNSSCFKFNV